MALNVAILLRYQALYIMLGRGLAKTCRRWDSATSVTCLAGEHWNCAKFCFRDP